MRSVFLISDLCFLHWIRSSVKTYSHRFWIFLQLSGHMTRTQPCCCIIIWSGSIYEVDDNSHLEVSWRTSCDVIHLLLATTLLFCLASEICQRGGDGVEERERGGGVSVACRPSVGLWCKRACERLPCDTPTPGRCCSSRSCVTDSWLLHLKLNAATHAVIGLVIKRRNQGVGKQLPAVCISGLFSFVIHSEMKYY